MSLSNSHNPQPTDTSLCGMLIWPLVDQQTREVESPVLKCFVSGPASGPILSSLPSLLGHFGPFPCMWDSRLEFCPVRHQWAIAGEEERHWWKWKFDWVVDLFYWLLLGCLSSLQLPCSPPHSLSSLSLFQAPLQLWSPACSCQSSFCQRLAHHLVMHFFRCPEFSTFAHLHQAPRLSPTHWSFFYSQLFFVPRW